MRLENRVAVVAGATGALGKVAAREFAKEGAHLVLLGRSLESLETVAREAGLSEDRYLPITADVTDGKATRSAADKTMARFGRVDILLNLVGGYVDGRTVVESDPQELEEMVRQHVWTTFHLAQAFVPHLTANGWGRLVVVSQPSAFTPPGKNAPYAVGKAGEEVLVLSLARELQDTGVTSNIVLVNHIDEDHEKFAKPSSKNASWSTPEEIALTILVLCSDESSEVNGARLPLYVR